MLLTSNYNENLNLLEILKTSAKYDIIRENLSLIQESAGREGSLVLSESEQAKVEEAAKKYMEDVRSEIEQLRSDAEKYNKLGKTWAWITLGMYIFGTLIMIPGTTAALVLSVIAMLLTIVFSIITVININKARQEVRKLAPIKKQLKVHASRVKDYELQDRLNALAFKIEKIESDIYDDTASERNTTYSMN